MNKIEKRYLIILIATNFLIYFILLPYAQNTANSHMNAGPFFGKIAFSFAFLTFIYSAIDYLKKKNLKSLFIILLIVTSLIYWGFRLQSLYCLGCANSG
jgi:asparagine N-glycosylation enzyme membrane subunit Stt3